MSTEDARKLFVAGLPESITEDVLRQLFEATGGKVVDVSLPRDRATGKVRGFGFVTFASSEEALRARDELDGSLQAGRSISVRPFSSEPPRRGEVGDRGPRVEGRTDAPPGVSGAAEDRTLYVGNLPYDTSQQELSELFTENGVGPVVRMHLPLGPDGKLRGFGFVTLATAEAANGAVAALRSADVRGRRLMVNIAHPRDRGPAGPSDRPRPPAGGWGGEPRFGDAPAGFDDRGGERRNWPATATPPESTESSEDAKKKKKKGSNKAATRAAEPRKRGGGSNWQSLRDSDDED